MYFARLTNCMNSESNNLRFSKWLRFGLGRVVFAGVILSSCIASAALAVTNNPASGAAATNVVPIPLAEVAARAESAAANLRSVEGESSSGRITSLVQADLPIIAPEIDARLDETSKIFSSNPSIPYLRHLANEWEAFHEELSGWQRDLTKRAAQFEDQINRLSQQEKTWEATLDSAQKEQIPPEIAKRIESVIAETQQTLESVRAQRTLTLTLLSRVADMEGRVTQMLSSVERARVELLSRLFTKDSPPMWSADLRSSGGQSVAQASRYSFTRQVETVRGYVERKKERFLVHALLILALAGMLAWVGRKLRSRSHQEPGLEQATLFFEAPIPTAIVLSMLASSWIYPQAPRLLKAIFGAAALVPATILLRKLVDRRLFPILDALVVLYFVDQLRFVAASQPFLSRWLFLFEMLGAFLFVLWLVRSARACSSVPSPGQRMWKNIGLGARIALALFGIALVADVSGYAGLGEFIGHAVLSSAYLALILYAAARILESLILVAFSVPPLSRLGMVNRHRELLHSSAGRLLNWVAIALWAIFVLEALSLRQPFFEDLKVMLAAKHGIGSVKLELGDVLLFVITVWAAFFVSRLLRFVLAEEVYPRVQLAPGLHNSVSTVLHYIVLLLGFVIALGLIGFNLSNLTILAGAFSVGLGFGLQNIVNNFVSGIILLFERPLKVGDLIQMDSIEGIVERIGIRASIVRTPSGAEIIVPNGKLISDPFTNWTLSDSHRRIVIPIVVPAAADTARVSDLLRNTAAAQPMILKEPPPQVLLTNPGGGSLNFELSVWTDQAAQWSRIRSELSLAVRQALAAQSIPLQ